MEGETSWTNHDSNDTLKNTTELNLFLELNEEEGTSVSLDSILPDDLQERILVCLPIASIFRAGSVSKKWNGIVSAKAFLRNFSIHETQKPWYYMFTSSTNPSGYAYDPVLRKWHHIDLPCIETSTWFMASSSGLIVFMDNDTRTNLYVCNPITKDWKKLNDANGLRYSDYSGLSIMVTNVSHYYVTLVKSKQVAGNYTSWDNTIQVYNSKTTKWVTAVTEVFNGWRCGEENVICGGVLYVLVYSTGRLDRGPCHGLVTYNLSTRSTQSMSDCLMKSFIPAPCATLTCGRLMNLKEKLVFVGGIGKPECREIIKGIGIWTLHHKNRWQEIGRVPHKFFQAFGELDDVFASAGGDDVIYIQSYGAPALLTYNVSSKIWRWSQKCPVIKRFPLQLFTGFCFEPRLDTVP